MVRVSYTDLIYIIFNSEQIILLNQWLNIERPLIYFRYRDLKSKAPDMLEVKRKS